MNYAPAPLPARFLAAFVDYLVMKAFDLAIAPFFTNSDYSFFGTLVAAIVYFSAGNSDVMNGQTLGKRVFRLRTVLASNPESSPSLSVCALRYLYLFGICILVIELPPIFFRTHGTIASPWFLECNMFAGLALTFANAASVIGHRFHRGIHDLLAGTIVVSRREEEETEEQKGSDRLAVLLSTINPPFPNSTVSVGVLIAATLWGLGIGSDPATILLKRYHFALEKQFPVRLQWAQADVSILESRYITTTDAEKMDDKRASGLCKQMLEFIQSQESNELPFEKFRCVFFAAPSGLFMPPEQTPHTYTVDVHSGEVVIADLP